VYSVAGKKHLSGDARPGCSIGKTQHVTGAFSRGHSDAEAPLRDGFCLRHAELLK
jgi:hypothetical protein